MASKCNSAGLRHSGSGCNSSCFRGWTCFNFSSGRVFNRSISSYPLCDGKQIKMNKQKASSCFRQWSPARPPFLGIQDLQKLLSALQWYWRLITENERDWRLLWQHCPSLQKETVQMWHHWRESLNTVINMLNCYLFIVEASVQDGVGKGSVIFKGAGGRLEFLSLPGREGEPWMSSRPRSWATAQTQFCPPSQDVSHRKKKKNSFSLLFFFFSFAPPEGSSNTSVLQLVK